MSLANQVDCTSVSFLPVPRLLPKMSSGWRARACLYQSCWLACGRARLPLCLFCVSPELFPLMYVVEVPGSLLCCSSYLLWTFFEE